MAMPPKGLHRHPRQPRLFSLRAGSPTGGVCKRIRPGSCPRSSPHHRDQRCGWRSPRVRHGLIRRPRSPVATGRPTAAAPDTAAPARAGHGVHHRLLHVLVHPPQRIVDCTPSISRSGSWPNPNSSSCSASLPDPSSSPCSSSYIPDPRAPVGAQDSIPSPDAYEDWILMVLRKSGEFITDSI